jgi:hypothetical protein
MSGGKSIVVTTDGHNRTIDKIAVSLFDRPNSVIVKKMKMVPALKTIPKEAVCLGSSDLFDRPVGYRTGHAKCFDFAVFSGISSET